jgi:hypothetical protein
VNPADESWAVIAKRARDTIAPMIRRLALGSVLATLAATLVHCVGDDADFGGPGASDAGAGSDAGPLLAPDGSLPGDDGGTGDLVDAAAAWDGNFGPEPPSSGTFEWQRVLSDGTATTYSITAVGGSYTGETFVAVRLVGAMTGIGTPTLSGPGFAVVKISADNKTVLWRQTFGSAATVRVAKLLVDEKGDVYVTGFASQAVALGTTGITAGHGFVAKLAGSDGAMLWAHEIGGTSSGGATLSTKSGKPIVLAGTFRGTLSYPGAAGALLRTGDASRSSAMVALLDRATGKATWVRAFLSSQSTAPAVDADMAESGNVEVALGIAGTVTGDPSGTVATLADVSIVMLTLAAANGAHSNVKHYKTVYMFDVGIRALPAGGAVVAGEAAGSSGVEIPSYVGAGSQDTWIIGTSAAHVIQWQHWFGGKSPGTAADNREYFGCLDVDHWGRALIGVSSYSHSVRLDGATIPGARDTAAFAGVLALAKFTAAGTLVWSKAAHAGDTAEVESNDCRFALNGKTLFSASLTANAQPNFGDGPVAANTSRSAAVVRWSP